MTPITYTREMSPCKNCQEKFPACHDCCPLDQRGDAGYKAWKSKAEQNKKNRKAYLDGRYRRIGG